MKLTFEITRAFILQGTGSDKVSLRTTESSPTPDASKELLWLDFSVARDGGLEYVRRLGIPNDLIEVIRTR